VYKFTYVFIWKKETLLKNWRTVKVRHYNELSVAYEPVDWSADDTSAYKLYIAVKYMGISGKTCYNSALFFINWIITNTKFTFLWRQLKLANILYHYLATGCKSRYNVSSARRLRSKSLAIQVLVKRSKEMEVTWSDATCYGPIVGRLRTTFPTFSILEPLVSTSLNSLRSKWLLSDLRQTPTWSKPSSPG